MSLVSIDGKSQPSVGKSDHWRLFVQFQESDLHTAIVTELQSYLNRRAIDSSIAGSEILDELSTTSPHLFDDFLSDQVGGLFGMTLWNLLAEQPEQWYFVSKQGDPLDDPAGKSYFRPEPRP